jgi:adenylate cyclase
MKYKEIERKFLIDPKKAPYELEKLPYQDIVQGYVTSIEKDLTFRLRHILHRNQDGQPLGEEWFQTVKGKGTKIRDEYEIRLLREQFTQMWKLCDRLTVHKWRYDLPCEDGILYLDCYKNELGGLWTLEVEFETLEDCDKFTPPSWFGKEVTEDYTYTNLQLAINGLPK